MFIKQLAESGFIQHLRSQIKKEDLEAFDKMVEEKIKEYDAIWTKIEPIVAKYNNGAKDVRTNESQSTGESRFDDKPDNE